MTTVTRRIAFALGLVAAAALPALAQNIKVQCPGDTNQNAVRDAGETWPDHQKCLHLGAGDGFSRMADGRRLYGFGFSNLTGVTPEHVMHVGMLNAQFPAPTIVLDEGDDFYLTLTNVGMVMRPDLFDPHTVHWHGYPNASVTFDGEPEGSFAINMMASLTYYYRVTHPGTYLYHCHAEATEHMQMGMLGNLWVRPRQNRLPDQVFANGFEHRQGYTYAYNDGDGSTRYDVDVPVQLASFDPDFHDASETIQPLPFAAMSDEYGLINGRGYPDTINPGVIAWDGTGNYQPVATRIAARQGQKVLLRLSNVSVTRFYTLSSQLPLKIVGWGARLLKGPDGKALYYDTNTVTLGGGEAADALLDTAAVPPGTYFLFASNLQYLNNNDEELGGMMTEIVVLPADAP